jgi:cell division septum initiation protein DivIVA
LIPVSATASSSAFAACKGCNRRIALEETTESPEPQSKATAPAFSQADFATLQQAIKDLQDRMNGYDQILAENNALKKENAAMKAQLATLQAAPVTKQQQPTRQQPVVAQTIAKPPTTWAQRAAIGPKIPNARRIAAAARAFQPNTGPQGYEFVYIQRHRRMDRSDIRRRLRHIGLDTSRIMDITFPSRNTLGLLIHIQYKTDMYALLSASKITPLDAFDPLDPKHIADPKHDALSTSDRVILAAQLHRERLVRGLKFMRPHVAPAVARSYAAIGWIEDSDIPTPPVRDRDHPAAAFQSLDSESDKDEDMSQDTEHDL